MEKKVADPKRTVDKLISLGSNTRMATETTLLPTTVNAVDESLRAEANNSASYRGIADDDYNGRNAFLLGMCEAKLAEAHAEYVRLLERQAATKGRKR